MNQVITVSPSAFGFLYEECRSCYFHEALGLRKRPRTPFPAVFTTIDLAMKRYFESREWHRFKRGGEAFRVVSQGRWVASSPIAIPGTGIALAIRGIYDSIIAFDDGARAVCDFKTSPVRPNLVEKYGRQLNAYALALERPAKGEPQSIDRLGLAVFEPSSFASSEAQSATLDGRLVWVEIERDTSAFFAFLTDVATLLAGPEPEGNPTCTFCNFRMAA